MSRARREQKQAAQLGRLTWRVLLIQTREPGKPPQLEVQCGGASTAQTILLLRKAADLLEAQTVKVPGLVLDAAALTNAAQQAAP